jgi:hypothetical protein
MCHIWAHVVVPCVIRKPYFQRTPKISVVIYRGPSQFIHHRLRQSAKARGRLRKVLQFCGSPQKNSTVNFSSPKGLSLCRLCWHLQVVLVAWVRWEKT